MVSPGLPGALAAQMDLLAALGKCGVAPCRASVSLSVHLRDTGRWSVSVPLPSSLPLGHQGAGCRPCRVSCWHVATRACLALHAVTWHLSPMILTYSLCLIPLAPDQWNPQWATGRVRGCSMSPEFFQHASPLFQACPSLSPPCASPGPDLDLHLGTVSCNI